MGLSVTLHKGISPSPLNDDGAFLAYQTDEMFLYNSTALQNDAWYVSRKQEHVIDYPYSSHRIFREKLAQLIGLDVDEIWNNPSKYSYIPFFKFINFADNEGVIDWISAKEIASHFVKYKDAAQKEFSTDIYFLKCYECWMNGFLQCSKKGNVIEFS